MKRISKIVALGLVLLFVFSLTGCRSTKEITRLELQDLQKEERINRIRLAETQYNTISASINLSLKPGQGEKNSSLDGQLRIIRGECIQISLRAPLIGSEVAKVQITPEQVVLIDRYHKIYLVESVADFKKSYPFDFNYDDLEALFTNRLFMTGYPAFDESHYKNFHLEEDPYFAYFAYLDKQAISYRFKTDYTNRIQETQLGKDDSDIQLTWEYADFKTTSDNQLFPGKSLMKLSTEEDTMEMRIQFKSVDINKSFELDYRLPTKYERVDLKSFLKMLGAL
ncbi:DUF4292 domain-containing protein [Bacteroidales bacterium OttesenSCG-928-J19]|nr:DUF4292 domain-containing protein [Bacteroidales bacterium OttesenSCG-928-J19]